MGNEEMYILLAILWLGPRVTTISSAVELSTESKELGPMAFRFFNGNNSDVHVDVPFDKGEEIIDLPGFDPSKKVLIYIHGFKENMNRESIHVIANAFLKRGDTNVIALDWSEYAAKDYITAIINCVTNVANAADIIKKMVARGIPLENFHLVGYSLGAQCAGYIGKRFKEQKLKTITGLDPAGPIIGFFCLTSLHKGDAEFVHMIHTDKGVYGISRSCGDFDVFFNDDGHRIQPGCANLPIILTLEKPCSHRRSWHFYAESVNDESKYICRICDNYKNFLNGSCSNTTLKAAYGADLSSRGQCYIETNSYAPFGRGLRGARHTTS